MDGRPLSPFSIGFGFFGFSPMRSESHCIIVSEFCKRITFTTRMPSHILLLGHARMGQWADLPACLVDSGQCRPEVQELVCGGWAGSYARTRRGHVYSMQRAKYRAIDAPGSRPAAAVDLSADSRIALPAGERCMGCVLDRPPERRRCCALVPCS
jgi:hypothetical protein